ncbi:pseudouridine synthase [Vampirovibrio chlorellavorus]|uniref:pseudouridine synthase n=1 Tax=Vampirovibrio chlorellavorus TaxID=758823 RepID=UPI0026EB75A0|nr:pseudouridine synthase [Vampirovibrio chlorellavorus]
MIRLNKAIADSGYCARRKADELIAQGKVKLNGEVVTELGTKVNLETDQITVNGQPLQSPPKVYLLLHKPVGYVTSRKAGKTQKSFYELIPPEWRSVDPAGRLDQDSSGALIVSNDGDFIYKVTHPRFHLPKVYEITLDRPLQEGDIQQLKEGVRLMPENKLAKMTRVEPLNGHRPTYQVELITGFNRQIRRTLIELRYRVLSLHRVSFGPVQIEGLGAGDLRPLTDTELSGLLAPPSPE